MRPQPLVCLRDEVPTALEAVVLLSQPRSADESSPGVGDRFVYVMGTAGLRYEHRIGWRGGRPAYLLPWADLAAAIEADRRRADVVSWAGSLTAPDKWRDLYRPYELWPNSETWHPSYIESEHQRPGWADRIAAWRTVQAILTDAEAALEPVDLLDMLAVLDSRRPS